MPMGGGSFSASDIPSASSTVATTGPGPDYTQFWTGKTDNARQGVGQTLGAPSQHTSEATFPLLNTQNEFHNQMQSNAVDIKATKIDKAAIPTHLWNDAAAIKCGYAAADSQFIKGLDILRKYMLQRWKQNVIKSLKRYLTTKHFECYKQYKLGERTDLSNEFMEDLVAARDCLTYTGKSTWWEWKAGSRLLFWRWPEHFTKEARDGIKVCWRSHQRPGNRRLQPFITDKDTKARMKEKISDVREKGYIKSGRVKSLIRYFPVPKGEEDVRIVYDGTDSGFNDMVWIPSFGLPTINTLLRGTSPTSWMVDLDIGEMFLNFMLEAEASEYVGVDLTPICDDELKEEDRVIWE